MPVPKGYTLDQLSPKLPPGYTLDTPSTQDVDQFAANAPGAAGVAAGTTKTEEPTPGFFKRAWAAINTPIGSHFAEYNKETEQLNRVQNFAETEAGRQAYMKHPILTGAKSVVAGIERDAADLLTPGLLVTALTPGGSAAVQGAVPEVAGAIKVAGKAARVAVPAGFGVAGVQQVAHAAGDTSAPIEQRTQEALGGLTALTGTAAEAGGGIRRVTTPGGLRRTIQEQLGAGEEFRKGLVEKYGTEAEKVRQAEQKQYEATERAKGVIDEANQAAKQRWVGKTVGQLKEDARKLQEARQTRAQIQAENVRTSLEHRGARERIRQERQGAEQMVGLRREAEEQHRQLAESYYQKEDVLKAQAKKAENETWAPWHEKARTTLVNADPAIAAIEKIGTRSPDVKTALSQLTPLPEDAAPESLYAQDRAAILKSQGYTGDYWDLPEARRRQIDSIAASSGFMPEPVDFNPEIGKPVSLELVHRAKSILGDKLARHEYAGVIEGEMKQVYGVLAQTEARGSLEIGALDDLNKAKAETAKYKDAFGRERVKRATVGEARKRGASREAYTDEQEQARLAAVAKYDPSLVEHYQAVQQAAERVEQFPTEERLRKTLKQPPDRPTMKPVPELPVPRPLPEPPQPKPYAEPEPTPPQAEVPDITAETRDKIAQGMKKYSRFTQFTLGTMLGGGLDLMTGGGVTTRTEHFMIGQAAVQVLRNILSRPSVLDWASRPTPETVQAIETLPPQDAAKMRDALTGMMVEDAKKGGRVAMNGRVARFIGSSNVALIAAAVSAGYPKTAGEAKRRVDALRNQTAASPAAQ